MAPDLSQDVNRLSDVTIILSCLIQDILAMVWYAPELGLVVQPQRSKRLSVHLMPTTVDKDEGKKERNLQSIICTGWQFVSKSRDLSLVYYGSIAFRSLSVAFAWHGWLLPQLDDLLELMRKRNTDQRKLERSKR